jgi:UMF1 family MFS transporter
MMLVDVNRGRTEGIALAKTLEELDAGHRDSISSNQLEDQDEDDGLVYPHS